MLNSTNKTAKRKENKMKQYAIVIIGECGDLTPSAFENVEEIFYFEKRDFLEEEFERLISHGPIWTDYRLAAVKDLKDRSGGKRRVASQYIRSETDYRDGDWESVHFYAVEFEGEKAPNDEYYIDFCSGYLDEYINELDEEDKPKGKINIIASSEEDSAFTSFKKVFDGRTLYLYKSNIEHYIEFYRTHDIFSKQIMENIDRSQSELDYSGIDYENDDYNFCDFVNEKGEIVAEKLEAVKAEQGWD